MAIVDPGNGRAIIESDGAGLRITIPARRQTFAIIFFTIWLAGWAWGELTVARQLLNGAAAADPTNGGVLWTVIWLAAWTLAGAWSAYTLLWLIAGKEVIELTATSLNQRKQIPIFSRSRTYAMAQIRNLRLAPRPRPSDDSESVTGALSFADGAIAFDYGRSTRHLAAELDDADADYVLGEMRRHVARLSASDEATRAWR